MIIFCNENCFPYTQRSNDGLRFCLWNTEHALDRSSWLICSWSYWCGKTVDDELSCCIGWKMAYFIPQMLHTIKNCGPINVDFVVGNVCECCGSPWNFLSKFTQLNCQIIYLNVEKRCEFLFCQWPKLLYNNHFRTGINLSDYQFYSSLFCCIIE